ncbi:hypothetical protein T190115A13A_160037 [Tenacibaculum sp. 190524A02b]|uniref:Uncharacterized protein n=1 Tax=Tenacibaculum vairaonense TaxID=3137860 RepID=A0ABP1FAM0_9FLAO
MISGYRFESSNEAKCTYLIEKKITNSDLSINLFLVANRTIKQDSNM